MQLVEVMEGPEGDSLPLEYDPDRIADYWGRRPVAVTTRILQLLGQWAGVLLAAWAAPGWAASLPPCVDLR
jgi:aarF domain-containing kinase